MKPLNDELLWKGAPFLVFAAFLAFYALTQPSISSTRIFSKAFAASAVIVLSASIGMTGVAKVWPKHRKGLEHRKSWGVVGFVFAFSHAALAFSDPLLFLPELASSRQNVRIGLMALVIFAALAVTSTRFAEKALGKNWKRIQRAGYVALALVLADVLVLGDGTFVKTPIGLVLAFAALGGLVLGVRGWFERDRGFREL
ncbi:ferric reductase-like transmembrane domain-containing protein [Candidatus Micrarchaeota archaeon]|nr:ferric reductase-like transmembrane domain-containing protein [Candidatus Micrarchaeota archaeon]